MLRSRSVLDTPRVSRGPARTESPIVVLTSVQKAGRVRAVLLWRWFLAFLFTQAVEVPVYALAARRFWPARATTPWRVAIAFGASALTHPFVWFVFPRLVDDWLTMVIIAEIFAWLAEAGYLRAAGVRKALWVSLAANAASLGLGLASRELFGAP